MSQKLAILALGDHVPMLCGLPRKKYVMGCTNELIKRFKETVAAFHAAYGDRYN